MNENTPTLTDEEKKYLESYKEENPFLKSLSEKKYVSFMTKVIMKRD